MQCPIDGTQLVMADRSGVEIDYCPQCRGVWLDRGELDKIIERSTHVAPAAETYDSYDDDYRGRDEGHRRKRRGGAAAILGEIFDF